MNEVSILGFHGTINYFANLILQDAKYKVDDRDNHWLGNGVYFFENDKDEAMWWANNTKVKYCNHYENEELKKTVLINEIKVDRDKLYDDSTTTDQNFLEKFIDENEDIVNGLSIKFKDKSLDKQKISKIIRGNIIFAFCKMNSYQVAKCAFPKPKNVSKRNYSNRTNLGFTNVSTQICVYDNRTIDFSTVTKEVLE
ncbi:MULTISPECIES: hypothetical protein [Staphylococcus]|uniref:hypothetical protein n=1 Tax=Staphylococcus TaxID=1279 RepID=UPI001D009708|nr:MULTISPECIES: hypothetical protein [Staphylococcus]